MKTELKRKIQAEGKAAFLAGETWKGLYHEANAKDYDPWEQLQFQHGYREAMDMHVLEIASEEDPAMNKWIKELEENARKSGCSGDNCLASENDLFYSPKWIPHSIRLGDKRYTIEQLEALTQHMKRYQK